MSRSFAPSQGDIILVAWNNLDSDDCAVLTEEMSRTGLDPEGRKAILIYYAPALIANTIKGAGRFDIGIEASLEALAHIYRSVRAKTPDYGAGHVTVNVNELAKEALTNPYGARHSIISQSPAQATLFTAER